MGVSVGVNALSVKSGHQGVAVREFPDVCKAPSPGGPVPIPYPNLLGPGHQQTAGSKAAAGKTLATGGSFSSIRGNEPGTLKGVASMLSERCGVTIFPSSATRRGSGRFGMSRILIEALILTPCEGGREPKANGGFCFAALENQKPNPLLAKNARFPP